VTEYLTHFLKHLSFYSFGLASIPRNVIGVRREEEGGKVVEREGSREGREEREGRRGKGGEGREGAPPIFTGASLLSNSWRRP